MTADSILDQIIENQQNQALLNFNPKIIINNLFSKLSDREKEIVSLRHGLGQEEKMTLEEIGKKFKITRERVRQIENSAIKKIKAHPEIEDKIKDMEQVVKQTIAEHGGIMQHGFLLEKILIFAGNSQDNYHTASFIIRQLLSSKLHLHEETEELHQGWKLSDASLNDIIKAVDLLIELINNHGQPLTIEQIIEKIQKGDNPAISHLNENIVNSYLVISKKVDKNPFNEWGMIHWQTINLKRISDKVYLILNKANQPMHFTQIAQKINEIGFNNKKANPATIHNELILDDKYVLVGRGIYALKEWGYKPGVVADVIKLILKENGPLTKEQIISQVLKMRQVKRSTIILALMNRNNFLKNADKTYTPILA